MMRLFVARSKRGIHIEQVTDPDYGLLPNNSGDRPGKRYVLVNLVNDDGTVVNPDVVSKDSWYTTSPSLVIDTLSAHGFSNYTLTIKAVGDAGGNLTLGLNVPVGGSAVFTDASIWDRCSVGDSAFAGGSTRE